MDEVIKGPRSTTAEFIAKSRFLSGEFERWADRRISFLCFGNAQPPRLRTTTHFRLCGMQLLSALALAQDAFDVRNRLLIAGLSDLANNFESVIEVKGSESVMRGWFNVEVCTSILKQPKQDIFQKAGVVVRREQTELSSLEDVRAAEQGKAALTECACYCDRQRSEANAAQAAVETDATSTC